MVKKILVDNESLVDILYHSASSGMDLGDRKLNDAKDVPLYGFTGNEVKVFGFIDWLVLFSSPPCHSWHVVKFHVVNVILGRTTLGALKAIISSQHLKLKFPTEFGVGEVCDQKVSMQCYLVSVIPKKPVSSEASVNQVVEEIEETSLRSQNL